MEIRRLVRFSSRCCWMSWPGESEKGDGYLKNAWTPCDHTIQILGTWTARSTSGWYFAICRIKKPSVKSVVSITATGNDYSQWRLISVNSTPTLIRSGSCGRRSAADSPDPSTADRSRWNWCTIRWCPDWWWSPSSASAPRNRRTSAVCPRLWCDWNVKTKTS